MTTYFTTVGRFKLKSEGKNRRYPVVYLGGEERNLDVQEMSLWAMLNWRILKYDEWKEEYEKSQRISGNAFSNSFDQTLNRLKVRGLIVEGTGETEEEALYWLISFLMVIPLCDRFFMKVFSFLKLLFVYRIPFGRAKVVFRHDKKTKGEKRIMELALQAPMSSAEMIKCLDRNIRYFRDEDDLIDFLYQEPELTEKNMAYAVRDSARCQEVITDVVNLYLRQQILFERTGKIC